MEIINKEECNECKKETEMTVRIGEEIDYNSATADICKSCLEKALKLLEGEGV